MPAGNIRFLGQTQGTGLTVGSMNLLFTVDLHPMGMVQLGWGECKPVDIRYSLSIKKPWYLMICINLQEKIKEKIARELEVSLSGVVA